MPTWEYTRRPAGGNIRLQLVGCEPGCVGHQVADGRAGHQVLIRGVGEFDRALFDGDERAEYCERFRHRGERELAVDRPGRGEHAIRPDRRGRCYADRPLRDLVDRGGPSPPSGVDPATSGLDHGGQVRRRAFG